MFFLSPCPQAYLKALCIALGGYGCWSQEALYIYQVQEKAKGYSRDNGEAKPSAMAVNHGTLMQMDQTCQEHTSLKETLFSGVFFFNKTETTNL